MASWYWEACSGQLVLGSLYWPAGTGKPVVASWYWEACTGQLVLGSLYWPAGTGKPVLASWYWEACSGQLVLGSLYWPAGTGKPVVASWYWGACTGQLVLGSLYWPAGSRKPLLNSCYCYSRRRPAVTEPWRVWRTSVLNHPLSFLYHRTHCCHVRCRWCRKVSFIRMWLPWQISIIILMNRCSSLQFSHVKYMYQTFCYLGK